MTDAPVRPPLLPIDRIVDMLNERLDSLVRDLLPAGRRSGQEWCEASTRQGGLGDSLSVHMGHGSKRGVFVHAAANVGGDVLDLIGYVRCGGDKKAAIHFAKAWLGIDGADPAVLAQAVAPAVDRAAEDAAEATEGERMRRVAHAIYLAAAPEICGTPVADYLLGRGLDVARLGFPVRALRFHPRLWDRETKRHWPAMLGAVCGADGTFLAVHRTFLEPLGNGMVRKAPIFTAQGKPASKRVIGRYRGGSIRLWRGLRTDPQTGEIRQARRLSQCKSGQWVDIAEGIENGLTAALFDPTARVLASVSISNLANLQLPSCVEGVVLWRDNDAAGSAADRAFGDVVAHFEAMGKQAVVMRAAPGFKDVNDMLQADMANGVREGAA